MQELGAALVELVLRRTKVSADAHPVVLAVHIAGLRDDRALGLAFFVGVWTWPRLQNPAGMEHTTIPSLAVPVVYLDHHQPPSARVDPVGQTIAGTVLECVAERDRSARLKRVVDLLRLLGIERRYLVGIHPLGDALVTRVGQIFLARPRIVEMLFPPYLLAGRPVVLVNLNDGGACSRNQIVVGALQSKLVEIVEVGDEAESLGHDISSVLVHSRIAAVGAGIGGSIVQHSQSAVDRLAVAVEYRVRLLALLKGRALFRG
jgi:hypothetical protein